MGKTSNTKKKSVYILLLVILVVLFLVATFLLLNYWENGQVLFPDRTENDDIVTVNNMDYKPKEDIQSILLIGLDKYEEAVNNSGYNNDQQADFVMLFVIDNKNGTYSALQLNRDTMVDINVLGVAGEKIDTVNQQLALAHTYGNGKAVSCRNTVDAVSGLLNNIDIDRYISVTMDAVPVVTDLVGGVEVTINDDFSSVDSSLVNGETVVLHGEQALTYVRTRQGLEDSSNVARMERQQQYLESLFSAFNEKAEQDDDSVVKASLELSDYILSNFTSYQLENLINNLADYEFGETYTLDGENKVGEKYMEFYADEDSVNDVVLDLFYQPIN